MPPIAPTVPIVVPFFRISRRWIVGWWQFIWISVVLWVVCSVLGHLTLEQYPIYYGLELSSSVITWAKCSIIELSLSWSGWLVLSAEYWLICRGIGKKQDPDSALKILSLVQWKYLFPCMCFSACYGVSSSHSVSLYWPLTTVTVKRKDAVHKPIQASKGLEWSLLGFILK